MKLRRKHLVWIALGVAAVAIIAVAMRPRSLPVETARAARGALETTVDADGRTRVRERYVVTAPVAGRLERIVLVEGDSVRVGDVVARLQPLPLDAPAAVQARSRLDAASALAREATARQRLAGAALVQRRRDLARAQRLGEAGGVAPRVVEDAALAERQAAEDARAASERVRAAVADVRQAEAALFAVAGQGRGTVVVRAPAAGRVLRIPERSERVLAAGTPLVELGDPATLEVVVDVLSSDGAEIRPGDPVRLTRWAGEAAPALAGRVRYVEPAAFTKVSALGVDEQRVNVIVDVPAAPPSLGDGFRVDASIVTWAAPSVLTVPTNALVRQGGGWSTFVVRDGRAARRQVRVGHLGATAAEVLGGLAAGDEVIVFPSDQVADGGRVAPRRG